MAAIKRGAKCVKLEGAPRGWHLKKVYEHTDGSIYSFGQPAKSKSQAKRVAIQSKKKKSDKKKAAPAKEKKAAPAKEKKVTAKKKSKGYKLIIHKATCHRIELETPEGEKVVCSEWNDNKKDAEEYKGRILTRYGDADGAAIVFDPKHPSRRSKKKKGWVVIEQDGTRHEFLGMGKVEAKKQFMRKYEITRLPHGTKVEKLI
jgi:hypothetical protein